MRCFIVCPGPSLDDESLLNMVVQTKPRIAIAVNTGILCGLSFDFWAVQDIEVFEHCISKQCIPCATLWIPERWLIDIPERYPHLLKPFNQMRYQAFPSDRTEQFAGLMPFGKELNWREFTVLTALGLAILRDQDDIILVGADMKGHNYYSDGVNNDRTNLSDERWRSELNTINEIQRGAFLHGIKIERFESTRKG